ncbi:hypothetical protein D918_07759 [Trichuris suis]|nr:hypothetical protein D918_07759 [Trichuris suis]
MWMRRFNFFFVGNSFERFLCRTTPTAVSKRCDCCRQASTILRLGSIARCSAPLYRSNYALNNLLQPRFGAAWRSSNSKEQSLNGNEVDESKLTKYQRFKLAFKRYWYVLLPVHAVTSAMWVGSFYYLVANGFDVVGVLQSVGVSEKIVTALGNAPKAGNIALAFALCKVIAPIRYAVTLGVTALSVRYLVRFGIIKPAPSREQVRRYVEKQRKRLGEQYEHLRQDAKGIRGRIASRLRSKKANDRSRKTSL